jgi:hypothetical protein
MDRLRWDNIARAAAVLAVIALVVAWPRLKAEPPALPSAAATPVTVEDPALAATGQAPASARTRRPPKPHHAPRARPRRPRARPRHSAPPASRPAPVAATPGPAAIVPPAPPAAVPAKAPPRPPAQQEFWQP